MNHKLTFFALIFTFVFVNCSTANDCICGIEREQNKIINGHTARPYRYPWMVFLSMDRPEGKGACGGTVINDRFIMTAAHCVNTSTAKGVRAFISLHEKPNLLDLFFGFGSYEVKKIHFHSEYKTTQMNDIALLEMRDKFKFNNQFGPICLPSFKEVNQYSPLTVIGWGSVNPFARLTPKHLQESSLEYISGDECNRTLGVAASYAGFTLDDNLILCAGSDSGVCAGDSGGPLFTYKQGRAYQMGIASFALNDCGILTKAPSAFTRVTSQLKWIENITKSTDAKWCKGSFQAIN